jgi:hypothetical protein
VRKTEKEAQICKLNCLGFRPGRKVLDTIQRTNVNAGRFVIKTYTLSA